jgi:hypothetical protein
MAEHRRDRRDRRRRRPGVIVLVPLALIASSAVVYQASNAAFTAQTTNGSNTWSSGSVTITDDDSNVAITAGLGSLKPGDTGTKCVNVTYGGSLAAAVRLYASAYGGTGLGQYLDFAVDEGTGATGGNTLDCTGFVLGTALYPAGTLNGFATTKNSYANGVSSWAPAGGSNAVKSYRFTWTLQDNNAAQGLTATATFAWEARNT